MKRLNKYLKIACYLTAFALALSCKTPYDALGDGMYAEMNTEKGTIVLQLYYKETPLTVANFITLAKGKNPRVADSLKKRKYYDGLKFHRVIDNFVIQSGDVAGDGTGGPGYAFKNEVPHDDKGQLKFKHERGVLAMANAGKDTNGAQFYITRAETPWLDGKYTIFGKVLQGMEFVDAMAQGDVLREVKIYPVGKDAKHFKAVPIVKEGIKR